MCEMYLTVQSSMEPDFEVMSMDTQSSQVNFMASIITYFSVNIFRALMYKVLNRACFITM